MHFHFIILIIRIFTAGFDLDINVLYPKVEYPVSRGTLGIQPLLHWVEDENGIRWENNDEKVSPFQFSKHFLLLSFQLEVSIRKHLHLCDSTKMGYEINGKNLFPLSVYLVRIPTAISYAVTIPELLFLLATCR